jgi:hypothetical protein
MLLSLKDRLRLAYSSVELWLGMLVLLSGAFMIGEADWLNLYFYLAPVATAPGRIATVYPTSFAEDDIAVRGFTYRYQVAGLEWAGNSYSTDSVKQPGMAIPVEYCVSHPAISRLQGTTIAPLGATSLLAGVLFGASGLVAVLKSIGRIRRLLALVADATLTKATREHVRQQTPSDSEDEVEYKLHYQYFASQQSYTLLVTTTKPDRYHSQELVVYEQAIPSNAALLKTLPLFIQTKLAEHG